ncbi:hypothetical protein OZX68_03640 [Streptococcaceae bacterium ESL0729]|nr:hypothetical protein OZX68_03640 [Streptococcaceae bacterium ESL0729]
MPKIKASGALNRYGKEFDAFESIGHKEALGKKMYIQFAQRKDMDAAGLISKNGGVPLKDALQVYQHVFRDDHLLEVGKIGMFDPDYDIAQSFSRIFAGKPESHDLTMIKHELLESKIMRANPNMIYNDAHRLTNKTYNYLEELDEWKDRRSGGD